MTHPTNIHKDHLALPSSSGTEQVKVPSVTANDLMLVVQWLEAGCDPSWAAKELRVYAARLTAAVPEVDCG